MAEKEATVFILDLGSTMAQTHSGRSESDLEWSMQYVWDKITDIVAANRKTLCVGVLGLRTDETDNKLQDDDGYENISVLQELGPMNMSSLRNLQSLVKPSNTWSGDAVSAIVLAVDMIDTFTKKLKWNRKIFLITDGQGPMDADDLADISKKMNDSNIQLTVLGIDFDDPGYGFKEEDKPDTKKENEKVLSSLVNDCKDGVFASIVEAIDELDTPRVKAVKPYKTYDGTLTLGDPKTFPAALNINVERYFKTHLARPLTASTVVVKSEGAPETEATQADADDMEGIEFSAVKQARSYKVNDPDAPGGKRDVEFDDLAKGYEYGRTAVHISESEHNITKLDTQKSFSIVGFIPCSKYEPFLNLGETCVTIARKFDAKSAIALSSLVWALSELESYAIARIVTKDGKDPLLVLLAPGMEPDMECLYDIPLPFAEDIRSYQFPPLDRVITVTGQTLAKHRLLPTDELNDAMSDYVDAMDLSTYGIDDTGEPDEYASIDETFNPTIHRINHAVKSRAVYPGKPVSEIPSVLLRFSQPTEDLIGTVQRKVDALIEAADVKKVPPKAKGKRGRETVKPISGLDVDALLGEEEKGDISPDNAVPEFKQRLAATEEVSQIEEATKQMGEIISTFITESFGDVKYQRALECLGVMREELINLEEPGLFNTFMEDMKKQLLSGAMGGDRRDFWFKVRWDRLGLIDNKQSEVSKVSPEDAEELLLGNGVKLVEKPRDEEDDNDASKNSPGQGLDGSCDWMEQQRILTQEQSAQSLQQQQLQQQAETYATRRRELADKKAKAFDNSKFRIGQTVDKNFAFCPFKVVVSYPERFIGKVNKPRAKPFFTRILYDRTWDFFYLHDPGEPARDPYLLIPSAQFEVFLEEVNLELDTALKIPPGVNSDKFYLKFGKGGTPRPRYLRRSEEETSLDIRPWPSIKDNDVKAFEAAPLQDQLSWRSRFRTVKSGFMPKHNGDPDKAARKKDHMEKMLRNTLRCLGLLGDPDGHDVVFICVDVEAIETKPHPISEIGIAVLDTRDIKDVDPGSVGRGWWPMIQTHHIRVYEYAGLRNYRFVKGCPGSFDFGTSIFPRKAKVADAIMGIFNPWLSSQRNIVIVGHDIKQDMNYFKEMGLDLRFLGGLAEPIDTQEIHQAWCCTARQRGLVAVLNDLDIENKNLHNAGNDAHYTLCAMLGIALESVREEEEANNKMLNKVD
ncbi:ATP-dependent DNA helicase 2 subunit 2 [Fusarium austroafricanum]|uniref:ATP-dependent DNA helicase II subunit 2 n=1 Tax=Fusarium austroafricanum TaxID=2364996 RepID=A0A8H4NMK1_9HYPO|nr:ATP-dependent DNA helicase 2 subunit 2 [Fusarium austroafricanum]